MGKLNHIFMCYVIVRVFNGNKLVDMATRTIPEALLVDTVANLHDVQSGMVLGVIEAFLTSFCCPLNSHQ
ncbi:hypothetical protein MANES_14G155601v8 [Manihot esculenta]|uniref:Lysosomal Pro-X carboxypeptidase n=1 Tax=Manihot esculenta TaxID=3983 RepID=A0A2C9UM64_MANES|nr:hypothetical protein MANES_14G155601v8 [Manihot esculenta]